MTFTRLISIFLLSLLVFTSVVVADEVVVSYKSYAPIVADVPFPLSVFLDTKGLPTLSYNLFVASTDGKVQYLSGGNGGLFAGNDIGANTPLDGGKVYRFQVKPKVGYDSSGSGLVFVLQTKLPGLEKSTVQLKMDGANVHGDNKVTPSGVGKKAEITSKTMEITPMLSVCGDGVVGYVDTDKNGIFDKIKEKQEACDTKYFDEVTLKLVDNPGCSSTCDRIQKEYRVKGFKTLAESTQCTFGMSKCVLEKLKPRELFKAKVEALIEGNCFPYNEYTDADYCVKGVGSTKPGDDGLLTLKQKIDLVARLGTALRELLENKDVVGTK